MQYFAADWLMADDAMLLKAHFVGWLWAHKITMMMMINQSGALGGSYFYIWECAHSTFGEQ